MDKNILQTFSLSRNFGELKAVDNLDLSVPEGSIYGFLGPNGAGKTTTIRMLLGLVHPSNGQVTWFGQPLVNDPIGLLKRVGSLIEMPSYYPHLTGFENLEVIRRLSGGKKNDIARVLHLVGLEQDANRVVRQYSLGMCQRLGLAIALLNQPEVLVLDEPINSLDPAGIHEMRELFQHLQEEGVTLFISSHLLSEIDQVATMIGIIRKGKLIFQGTPSELRAQYPRRLSIGTDRPEDVSIWLKGQGYPILQMNNHHIDIPIRSEDESAKMNKKLSIAGFPIFETRYESISLEGIFLQVTSRENQSGE
ncbi:ABC transporter ATP-binding protein [Pelolinea submarina]|uniref:ABC-2 type transport system ATP-binding protein n=1 Tax=Pelolinea submarina TaxID=913107 RepID=A0A347ZP30_9CHLR|nr:ABC transporter ATP-binding protein [Pelolinea submarina]REG08663.1 ABC-2 type transport system ATP-binding protein [Pelolinea submarina]BBB47061.1 lantibiotic transport system ATP-binding protein [Pelolinea submarina]